MYANIIPPYEFGIYLLTSKTFSFPFKTQANATSLIGLLPSYPSISFLSLFLLTIFGILQTMSVSAEPRNSGRFANENESSKRKGFMTMWR